MARARRRGSVSVREYQQALDTLRHMSEERAGSRARHPGAGGARLSAAGPPAGPEEPREPISPPAGLPVPAEELVRYRVPSVASSRRRRSRRPALRRLVRARRPSRALLVAAAAVVAVTAAALALQPALGHVADSRSGPAHLSAPAGPHPATRSTGRSAPPAPPGYAPVTESSTAATYRVSGGPVSALVTATGPCWVSVTDVGTGRELWSGTLLAGQKRSFQSGTGLLLRLGKASDVTLSLGGEPVRLPEGFTSPFDVNLVAT